MERRALRGTVFDDGLNRDPRVELDNLHSEVAAAGKHLSNDSLTLRWRSGAFGLVFRTRSDCGGERHDRGYDDEISNAHFAEATSFGRGQLYDEVPAV